LLNKQLLIIFLNGAYHHLTAQYSSRILEGTQQSAYLCQDNEIENCCHKPAVGAHK